MNKWIGKAQITQTEKQVKLTKTMPLIEMEDDDFKQGVGSMYLGNSAVDKRTASFYNAINTHANEAFFLTFRLFNDLVRDDTNSDVTSCEGSLYKKMLHIALKNGIIEVIRPHVGRQSALYKVIDKDFLKRIYLKIGEEASKSQVANAIRIYDEYKKDKLSAQEAWDKLKKDKGLK